MRSDCKGNANAPFGSGNASNPFDDTNAPSEDKCQVVFFFQTFDNIFHENKVLHKETMDNQMLNANTERQMQTQLERFHENKLLHKELSHCYCSLFFSLGGFWLKLLDMLSQTQTPNGKVDANTNAS